MPDHSRENGDRPEDRRPVPVRCGRGRGYLRRGNVVEVAADWGSGMSSRTVFIGYNVCGRRGLA